MFQMVVHLSYDRTAPHSNSPATVALWHVRPDCSHSHSREWLVGGKLVLASETALQSLSRQKSDTSWSAHSSAHRSGQFRAFGVRKQCSGKKALIRARHGALASDKGKCYAPKLLGCVLAHGALKNQLVITRCGDPSGSCC